PWYTVGLSIMATQASAITFLSAPGQAYTEGMGFVQFYFGLPLAMIILSVTAVPIYHRLKVYTAYEYLEGRFDLKTRSLAALLFLTQRGLAAGLTIYAPSIILSSIMGWNIYLTNLVIGGIVIIYTVGGGTRAVSYTQLGQMAIILTGMLIAGVLVVNFLPANVSFTEAMHVAGKMDRLNALDFSFSWDDKYNIWSGLIGGLFLALSYFGTDQSQVARYLSGKSVAQSRLGLLFNGIVKIPMQFAILFIGAMLFVFFQFHKPPVFFNQVEIDRVNKTEYRNAFSEVERQFDQVHDEKQEKVENLLSVMRTGSEAEVQEIKTDLNVLDKQSVELRDSAKAIIKVGSTYADPNDTNYIFLYFVMKYFPAGLVGLLIAVIFAASMSSTSSELNALASTSIVDIYKRTFRTSASDSHYLFASKAATIGWGIYAIAVAMFANQLGSLIEAVNVLGSLFYGTILGIFLAAFYFRGISGTPVFIAAIISEVAVIAIYTYSNITYLWFNVIGCVMVILLAYVIEVFLKPPAISKA
ncbi:MAG: sodium:solute symporter, partial [Bacteroidota bacterium]|nr:sodium:solute symporter [Bacteroidota bacterium]